jgi:FkbM family methyltransferase
MNWIIGLGWSEFYLNWFNFVHTIKTLASLFRQIFRKISFSSWKIAFLCGGLASMGLHRKGLRSFFITALNKSGKGADIEMRFKLCGRKSIFLMREGNLADYLIGGELVWGAYSPPKKKPTFIVDGGANIGMFSVLARAYFPDVPIVCYEPDKANLRQLERNLSVNGISAEVVPKALWSRETTLFYRAGESYTGHVDENPPGEEIECAVPRVQDGCWLKLDIEGAEYEVLPQILASGVRPEFISMEIHSNREKGEKLVRLLENSGYQLEQSYDPMPDCINVEAEFRS